MISTAASTARIGDSPLTARTTRGRCRPKSTTSLPRTSNSAFSDAENQRDRDKRPVTATRTRTTTPHNQLPDHDHSVGVNPFHSFSSPRHNRNAVNTPDAVSDAALLKAVCAGDDVAVSEILAGPRRDSAPTTPRSVRGLVDSRRRPVLCVLLEHGASPVIMRALLQHGADPDGAIPVTRQTPLHIAAKHGYQVCVNLLLSFGACVESLDANGNTPLMTSCRGAHTSIVRLLIQHGSSVDDINSSGQTALHLVADGRQDLGLLCAKALLTESDIRPSSVDNNGRTPLLLATINNQVEIAMLLLDYDSSSETINLQDLPTGQTCLHWAVRHQSIRLVRRLIDLGADINIRDRDWNTPFMVAVTCRYHDIVSMLVGAGCDMQVTDRQFNTALHLVSRDGLSEFIPLLVHPPRRPSHVQGHTPLGDIGITIEGGLDINLKGLGGVTALMLAANRGHVTVVGELLKAGADPDVVDRHRATALMYALMTSAFNEPCPTIIKMLIRHNCDVDKAANIKEMCKFNAIPANILRSSSLEEGRLYTPLEVSFLRGQVTAFSILVRAGADLTQFRWLYEVASSPTFASCLHTWALPSVAITSSGAQAAAVMVRSARHRLRKADEGGVMMSSLAHLCVRPALQALISEARNRRIALSDVIASLSSAVNDDVKRMLTLSHLDDATPLTSPGDGTSPLPNVTSPTSPVGRRESYEPPTSGKRVTASPTSRPTAPRAFPFSDVAMKPRSLPQAPSITPSGSRSPKRQPYISYFHNDDNANEVTTSPARHGNETTRNKIPLRPKSCALERPTHQRSVRIKSATPRCTDDINAAQRTSPLRRRLPVTPGTSAVVNRASQQGGPATRAIDVSPW